MGQPVPKPEPPTPEADRLVRLVVGGDTQAFAGLVRLYGPDVWRIASTLVRDWAATESLVQQAFIDAYTHLHSYQLGTDFGAWIRTLTRNRLRKEPRTLTRAEQRLAVYREQQARHLAAVRVELVLRGLRTEFDLAGPTVALIESARVERTTRAVMAELAHRPAPAHVGRSRWRGQGRPGRRTALVAPDV